MILACISPYVGDVVPNGINSSCCLLSDCGTATPNNMLYDGNDDKEGEQLTLRAISNIFFDIQILESHILNLFFSCWNVSERMSSNW